MKESLEELRPELLLFCGSHIGPRMPGSRGSQQSVWMVKQLCSAIIRICFNRAAARLVQLGDLVIIASWLA